MTKTFVELSKYSFSVDDRENFSVVERLRRESLEEERDDLLLLLLPDPDEAQDSEGGTGVSNACFRC